MPFIFENSRRHYTVAYLEGNHCVSYPNVNLQNIFENHDGSEYNYAIQENIDSVLDLKVGERLMMDFNRDNPDSTGFIKRLKNYT